MLSLCDFIETNFSENSFIQEKIRILSSFDLECNDRLKIFFFFSSDYRLCKRNRLIFKKKKNFVKNKLDIFTLIKKSKKGIKIQDLLSSYEEVNDDLLDLVKISGRNRKLIILKGLSSLQLSIFFLDPSNWIVVSNKTVERWHSIKNENGKNY